MTTPKPAAVLDAIHTSALAPLGRRKDVREWRAGGRETETN